MADCDRPPPNFLDKAGTPPIPWKSWLRMFERYILATGAQEYSAERRQAKLLNCLGVEGQRIYDSRPAPVGPAPATSPAGDGQQARQASRDVYRETLTVLEAEFLQPVNETLQQLRFHMRKQQEGESLRDFLSALRALAVPANFGADTEAVIRRQFMVSAASAKIQERLVLDAALPFSVALQTVLNLERSRREVREWASATAPAAPSTASQEHVTCHVTGRATSQPQPMMSSLHEPWRSRRESPVRSPTVRSSAASARSVNARASRSPSQQSCVTCGRSGDGAFDRGSRQQSPGRSAFRRSVRFESPRRQPSPRRNYGYRRTCPNCGYGQEHCRGYDVCPARGQHCDNCDRRGHFSRACRSVRRSLLRRPRDQVEQIVDDYYDDDDEQWEVSHISGPSQTKLYLNIQVFDSTLQFFLDTGSAVSIVDSAMFVRYFSSKATVVPPPVKLLNFSQQPITILGAFEAPVMFRERAAKVLFYIADRGRSVKCIEK
ncbi:uncharacterized protein LOC120839573 [Ixodes scapularis]|uniref:uncharacterized protein LOC120839573 n=1 Tax=Ixodes scapularis TaxID=6945 RepID=UPI001A9DD304|nr:uncharacterized protein LOC120839573 [Ixodes scapularis]